MQAIKECYVMRSAQEMGLKYSDTYATYATII